MLNPFWTTPIEERRIRTQSTPPNFLLPNLVDFKSMRTQTSNYDSPDIVNLIPYPSLGVRWERWKYTSGVLLERSYRRNLMDPKNWHLRLESFVYRTISRPKLNIIKIWVGTFRMSWRRRCHVFNVYSVIRTGFNPLPWSFMENEPPYKFETLKTPWF